MTAITFDSEGYKLAGNLFHQENVSRYGAFLFIQGWTGHQNLDAAQAVAELGYKTMTYDMRGHGESEGNLAYFSRAHFVHDACVAYDYLRLQVGSDVLIGVIGSSFGSYTAAILSTKRDTHCLSLRVPANYPDKGFDEPQLDQFTNSDDFRAWREKALNYQENLALTAVHNFKDKIQIIEAENDELVNSQVVKNYVDAVADKSLLQYEVMANAPHRLVTEELRADYRSRLVKWVQSL